MKIVRIDKEVLSKSKSIIRSTYDFDSKDKDKEVYRVLIPTVPSTEYLINVVDTFVTSKARVNDFYSKYSFHCANRDIVNTVKSSIDNGGIKEYKEFQMPVPIEE